MTDPYQVLNVPRTATDEEIKKAYRALARKYHPDNYAGSDLADLASEKMKEINEAYDRIQRERASSSSYRQANGGGYTSGGYSSGGESGGTSAAEAAAVLARVRTLINAGRFAEAGVLLDGVSPAARSAEWNYLKGCVLLQRGWYFDAQKYFEIASYMDPTNAEYRAALERMRQNEGQFGRAYQGGSDCSPYSVCMGLLCADGLCECCGGDLIRCC